MSAADQIEADNQSVEDLKFLRWLERVAPETVKTWRQAYDNAGRNNQL